MKASKISQVVRWILACTPAETSVTANAEIFLWRGRARGARGKHSYHHGGLCRDVGGVSGHSGHRGVDLRCLRASCRPLRGHLRIREATGKSRPPPQVDEFRSKMWSRNSMARILDAKSVLDLFKTYNSLGDMGRLTELERAGGDCCR